MEKASEKLIGRDKTSADLQMKGNNRDCCCYIAYFICFLVILYYLALFFFGAYQNEGKTANHHLDCHNKLCRREKTEKYCIASPALTCCAWCPTIQKCCAVDFCPYNGSHLSNYTGFACGIPSGSSFCEEISPVRCFNYSIFLIGLIWFLGVLFWIASVVLMVYVFVLQGFEKLSDVFSVTVILYVLGTLCSIIFLQNWYILLGVLASFAGAAIIGWVAKFFVSNKYAPMVFGVIYWTAYVCNLVISVAFGGGVKFLTLISLSLFPSILETYSLYLKMLAEKKDRRLFFWFVCGAILCCVLAQSFCGVISLVFSILFPLLLKASPFFAGRELPLKKWCRYLHYSYWVTVLVLALWCILTNVGVLALFPTTTCRQAFIGWCAFDTATAKIYETTFTEPKATADEKLPIKCAEARNEGKIDDE